MICRLRAGLVAVATGVWRVPIPMAIDALRCDAIADAAVRDVPWCAFLSYFFVFGYYYEDTWLKWRCVRA